MKKCLFALFLILSLVLSAWSFTNFNTAGQGDIVEIDTVPIASIVNVNTIANPADASFYNEVIDYSVMLDSASGTAIKKTWGTAATLNTKATVSVWLKRTTITSTQLILSHYNGVNNYSQLFFNEFDELELKYRQGGATASQFISTAKFRDCSGWYHLVLAWDSTSATAADRIPTVWVNGVNLADDYGGWGTETNNIGQNDVFRPIVNTQNCWIGENDNGGAEHFNGYMAQFVIIDGTAYAATDFGETKEGIWIPKDVSGLTFGNNGILLTFADNTSFGDDTSGNANDFTDANLGTDHQSPDTPEDNYCTLDFNARYNNASATLTEGGLRFNWSTASFVSALGTFTLQSGKWYYEVDIGADLQYVLAGITRTGVESRNYIASTQYVGYSVHGASIYTTGTDYELRNNGSGTSNDNLDAPANDDVLTVAFDADTGEVWFGLYNAGSGHVWGDFGATGVGDPANGTNPAYTFTNNPDFYEYVPAITTRTHLVHKVNFGQTAFSGTIPSGFKAIKSSNLPDPTVNDPQDDYANVVLYTGDGSADQNITGVGFQPDFVWIKNRDQTDVHQIFDDIRGATNYIDSTTTTVQTTDADTLLSFDADGFSVGADVKVNTNTENYVAWCLKEQTGFFDIMTYEGTGAAHTESHNLGVVPHMIIIKNLDQPDDWTIYAYGAISKADPETDYGELNQAAPWFDLNTIWNDTAPTSTVFTVGTADQVNASGETYVAYLFGSLEGISRVLHYEGGGASANPYVWLGFKPLWVIFIASAGAYNRGSLDIVRDPYNIPQSLLYPNLNNAEPADADRPDLFSNGLKTNGVGSAYNQGAQRYVGIAFADQPFKYSNAH